MRTTQFLTSLAVFGFAGLAHAGEWTVAQDTSSVGFSAEQQGSKFRGKFANFSAIVDFDPASPASGSIVGTVETESVDTRDYDRDGRLVEPDWFDSAKYAEARFESESIEVAEDGSFVAHGQLTLKGQTKPIDLSFSFSTEGNTAKFDGKLQIDRFEYNVGQGWNDTYMVGKDVEVNIVLDLSR
jgi:polyisoprenoid-binding protein YceI